jgi:hypothetical protein
MNDTNQIPDSLPNTKDEATVTDGTSGIGIREVADIFFVHGLQVVKRFKPLASTQTFISLEGTGGAASATLSSAAGAWSAN